MKDNQIVKCQSNENPQPTSKSTYGKKEFVVDFHEVEQRKCNHLIPQLDSELLDLRNEFESKIIRYNRVWLMQVEFTINCKCCCVGPMGIWCERNSVCST